MRIDVALAIATVAVASLGAGTASADNEGVNDGAVNEDTVNEDTVNEGQVQPQMQSLASAYRGMFVCERQTGAADILRAPFDLAVRGDEAQFARPLFDLLGKRVLGSELGSGWVDAGGQVHLTSAWDYSGITVRGDYTGTLTSGGGTLTGTQSWRGPDGEPRSRTCQIALVPAAWAHTATK
jgi:hypothetical protein